MLDSDPGQQLDYRQGASSRRKLVGRPGYQDVRLAVSERVADSVEVGGNIGCIEIA
jgi:hypothetical protein